MAFLWAVLGAFCWGFIGPASAAEALQVVFPPSGYRTTSETIFFIGTAPPSQPVAIAGQIVPRSPAGHFAPRFPLALGDNAFLVRQGAASQTIHVIRLAMPPVPPVGLAFAAGTLQPADDLAVLPGERVTLSAFAPPNATVHALVGDRRIPLNPQPATVSLPDNKAALVSRAGPLPLVGIARYEGSMRVPASLSAVRPVFELSLNGKMLRQVGTGRLSALDAEHLSVVEVSADEAVARTGPSTDYSRLTPLPKGVRSAVVGMQGEWLRLAYGGWLKRAETTSLPLAEPPATIVRSLQVNSRPGWTDVVIPLEVPVPYSIQESDGRFELTLHQATAQTDIVPGGDDALVSRLDFVQDAPERLRYVLSLKARQAAGYQVRYEGTTLVLSLRHPAQPGSLAGRRILLDAGHGGLDDVGATGPTGLLEKDLTLKMARLVRDELLRRGASVLMSRDSDTFVDLPVRTELIRRQAPDLSLSLHYNALPDPGDPANTRGIGTFWYHPHSAPLAAHLQAFLTRRLERPSYGLFWDNLALTRPSVCPAVLLEMAFLINPEDFEWASDSQAQGRLAVAIADALGAWFSEDRSGKEGRP